MPIQITAVNCLPLTVFFAMTINPVVLANQNNADSVISHNSIEHISVTASGFQQLVADAPASISVIDREQLDYRAYKDLTDVLRDIAGVTVSGGGSRQDISIRGMPAQYTALLVDGKKQSGRESQPNGSGGFEQDWLPPVDAIERIEVVRGPMSTLYGSDAIGGVINIITRKDQQHWSGNLRLESILQQDSHSGNEYRSQIYLSGPLIKNTLNASVSAMTQRRLEDDIERGYGEKSLTNVRSSINYLIRDTDTLSAEVIWQQQDRSATSGRSLPERSSSNRTDNHRQSYSLTHEGNYRDFSTRSFIQREEVENRGRNITITNTLANTQWNLMMFEEHIVTVGAEYANDDLTDPDNINSADLSNRQWSAYVSDEWQTSLNTSLTTGLRLDNNDQFDSHLSPRLFGVWTMSDKWTLKGGVSTGYRTPDLRDMASGWVQESRGGNIYGNAELAPETTVSKEIGIYYSGASQFTASASVFHNDFDDKISLATCPLSLCDESGARYNINVDEAESQGAEVMFSKHWTSFSLQGSYAYTESEQLSGLNAGLPLTQLPRHKATLNPRWKTSDTTEIWSRITYRGKESEPVALSSRNIIAPSRTLVDIGVNWTVNEHLEVLTGLYNLFDKTMGYDEYGFVEDGRRVWLSANIRF